MSSRIVCRLSARKISGSCRLVMRSVFVAGDGKESGGKEDRSSDIGVRGLEMEDLREQSLEAIVCSTTVDWRGVVDGCMSAVVGQASLYDAKNESLWCALGMLNRRYDEGGRRGEER